LGLAEIHFQSNVFRANIVDPFYNFTLLAHYMVQPSAKHFDHITYFCSAKTSTSFYVFVIWKSNFWIKNF